MTALFSGLLSTPCVMQSNWVVVELGEASELHFRRQDHAFLHLVIEGQLQFDRTGPVLSAGDFAIVLDGRAHTLRTGLGGRRFEARHLFEDPSLDCPPTRALGDAPRPYRLLSAALELYRAGPQPIICGWTPILFGKNDASAPGGSHAFRVDPHAIERAAAGAGGMAFLRAIADLLLVQAARMAIEALSPAEKTAAERFASPQIAAALRLMDTQPGRTWSVSSLAAMVGMSRSAFAALFRQSIGGPPMQYLSKMRIEQSARLLRSSPLPIARVAQDVGYDSVSSFARAFKNRFGATPGAYRRAIRQRSHRNDHSNAWLEANSALAATPMEAPR